VYHCSLQNCLLQTKVINIFGNKFTLYTELRIMSEKILCTIIKYIA